MNAVFWMSPGGAGIAERDHLEFPFVARHAATVPSGPVVIDTSSALPRTIAEALDIRAACFPALPRSRSVCCGMTRSNGCSTILAATSRWKGGRARTWRTTPGGPGPMPVENGAHGRNRWMEYEDRLTKGLANLNCFALCQYHRQLLPPELVGAVIRTHPSGICRGVVCPNMYHVPPDEFLGTNQRAHETDRLITTLRKRIEIEYTLRQQRDELRTLANRLTHAQDDERRRIATMLHETTAQDLAALKMLLGRLDRARDRLTDSERAALTESISLAEHAMTEVRTVSYLLHPPFLD